MTAFLAVYISSLLVRLAQGEIHFSVEPHQGTHIRAGDLAKFTCSAITDYGTAPRPIIEWKINEEPILHPLHSRYVMSHKDSSLTIYNSTVDDTGVFTCIASFGEYKAVASAELVVQDVPDAPMNVKLENCHSRLAQISWQLLNENNSPVQFFIIQYNTSFKPEKWSIAKTAIPRERYIERIALSPWGNYSFRVIARNALGDGPPSKPTTVICQAPPDVPHHNPHDVCTANDVPSKLIITWKPMSLIKHNAPGFHYVVRWKRYDKPETTVYSQSTVEADRGRLVIDDQPVYKPYEIKVLAVNSIGKAISVPHGVIGYSGEDVPLDAPHNFELDDDYRVTNTTAHFMWEPVQTSVTHVRGFFRGYRIEFWITENPSHRKIHDIILDEPDLCKGIQKPDRKRRKVGHGQVRDLWPDSNITAHIRVLNMKYAGPPSQRITFVTEEGVPEYVQNVRLTSVGSTHFVLNWQKPNVTNGDLIGYKISYKAISDYLDYSTSYRLEHISDPDQTQVKLMGLTSQRTYQISVCARTRTGCGQGYVVELDTLPNTAPEMPVFIAVSINKTKLNVTWLPSNKGNPGCKFSVSYRQLGKLLWKHTPNIVYEDWVVLTGLRWGAVHEVRVTAKTCGRGKEFQQTSSPIRQIQIGEILNYSVPTFKVHQIDGTSFGVSLISASKLVMAFYVQYKEAGSTSWSATDDKKRNEWVIIRNLIKGVMYEVRAVTRSEMGQTAGNIQYHVTGTETEIHSVSEWKGSGTSQARLTMPLFWLVTLYIKNAIPWLL